MNIRTRHTVRASFGVIAASALLAVAGCSSSDDAPTETHEGPVNTEGVSEPDPADTGDADRDAWVDQLTEVGFEATGSLTMEQLYDEASMFCTDDKSTLLMASYGLLEGDDAKLATAELDDEQAAHAYADATWEHVCDET